MYLSTVFYRKKDLYTISDIEIFIFYFNLMTLGSRLLFLDKYPSAHVSSFSPLSVGSRLLFSPNISGPSADLSADHHERREHDNLDQDRRDRSLNAERAVVEEAVPRCRRIQLEDRVRHDVPAVGQPRQDALGEVPARMHRHRHPQTVKIVNRRTEKQSRYSQIHDCHR